MTFEVEHKVDIVASFQVTRGLMEAFPEVIGLDQHFVEISGDVGE